ncbi:MAG TPA: MATE family efflux transporter [Sphingomonas sp.]|nr:MATE family efflux transporter [Sphingomonas sp.]
MTPAIFTTTIAPAQPTSRRALARVEFGALVALAAPLVSANLLQMAVYAVDTIFVARLGTVEFAAATLGVFLFSLMMWSLVSMVSAGAPIIAAELGRRAHAVREVRRTFRMAMWLSVFVTLPALALLLHGETVLRFAGQDPVVARRAGAFLDIVAFALIPGILAGAMRSTAAALGRPGWTLIVTALALALAIATNWLFVFGHWGFPAMGLEGSALSSLVTMTAMALAYAAILAFDRKLRRYRLFGRWWRPEWPRMRRILTVGLPIAFAVTFEGGLFGGAGLLMGLIGVEAVAAHAVALNIASIAFQIPYGIAQAATIRVGLAYGAGDRAWIGRAGWVAIASGTAAMAFTASLMLIAPRLFVGIYLDVDAAANAVVVALAVRYLAVGAAFQLFDGAQAVAAGALRGLQDTRVPMVVALFGYWGVGLGSAVFFAFQLGMAGVGVWIGLALGLAAVTAMLVSRWRAREPLGLVGA